jgi:uncharacterized membrane protein HdeD (DUF308 family)
VTDFVLGGTAIACLAIALFFLRFYRDTTDRLFAAFAAAFLIFGVNRLILALVDEDADGRIYAYTLRLVAFLLVVWGIVDKNRSSRSAR